MDAVCVPVSSGSGCEFAAQPGQPYEITASIGYVCFPASEPDALDAQIREADRRMYDDKTARKKQRQG